MQLYTVITALLLASSAIASAIPDMSDDELLDLVSRDIDNSTEVFEGVPDFDPKELYLDESLGSGIEERDLDSDLESRATPAQKIVSCAKSYIGVNYLWGGCKTKKPFGPSAGGMDCSCLSRTCVYKGTGKTIRKLNSLHSTIPGYHTIIIYADSSLIQHAQPRHNTPTAAKSATLSIARPVPSPATSSSGAAVRKEASITWEFSPRQVTSSTHHGLERRFRRLQSGERDFATML
jgi:hypothetical protein